MPTAIGWCDRCKKTILYDPTDDGPHLCDPCKEEWEKFHKAHAKEIKGDKMKKMTSINGAYEIKKVEGAPVDDTMIETVAPELTPIQDDGWPTATIHVSKEIWERIAAPNHYVGDRKHEPAMVAYDWGLDFNCGSALKYISRLGRKEGAAFEEDLCKAIRFLMLELEAIQEHKG